MPLGSVSLLLVMKLSLMLSTLSIAYKQSIATISLKNEIILLILQSNCKLQVKIDYR